MYATDPIILNITLILDQIYEICNYLCNKFRVFLISNFGYKREYALEFTAVLDASFVPISRI